MAKQTETKTTETKREHFKRLAEHRVSSIIEWAEKLGRLNNQSLYEYSEEDITKIEAALNGAVEKALTSLRNKGGKRSGFTL